MQVYGRGLRRRLAPMLGGNQKWIRLAYSVLFSLPGAPMVFYGEELGMAEQPELPGRMSVRAPMQWTPYDNGGFSSASPERFVRPILAGEGYGFEHLSVGKMRADPDSLLNWITALMRTRRECSEIGSGKWQLLETGNDAVLGLRHDVADSSIVVLNNLSSRRQVARLELTAGEVATVTDLFCSRRYDPIALQDPALRMEGFGFRWMRISGIY
jgi:glycosidase